MSILAVALFKGSTINKFSSVKDLGLIIDDSLSWVDRSENISNSLIKYIVTGIFCQLKDLLPTNTTLQIYTMALFIQKPGMRSKFLVLQRHQFLSQSKSFRTNCLSCYLANEDTTPRNSSIASITYLR